MFYENAFIKSEQIRFFLDYMPIHSELNLKSFPKTNAFASAEHLKFISEIALNVTQIKSTGALGQRSHFRRGTWCPRVTYLHFRLRVQKM